MSVYLSLQMSAAPGNKNKGLEAAHSNSDSNGVYEVLEKEMRD